MPTYTICSCAVEKNVHFSCQSFMASFRASCHCPSQNSKTQKHNYFSSSVTQCDCSRGEGEQCELR